MRTRISGKWAGTPAWLEWEDGTIDGSTPVRVELTDVVGEVYAGPEWPAINDPDVRKHMDFVVVALTLLGRKATIEGDLPPRAPVPAGAVG